MRLRRLRVERLPGIRDAFELDDLAPGVNVVVGPNGSGKSSLCRALRCVLWPELATPVDRDSVIEIEFDLDGERWNARRAGDVVWSREGRPHASPPLPAAHLARCYTLALSDLLEARESGAQSLAHQVRVQMAGGYDLRALGRVAGVGPRHGRREVEELATRRRARERLERVHRDLAEQEDTLAGKRAERDALRARLAERALLDRSLALARDRAELARLAQELDALPGSLARLRGGELETLDDLERELATLRRECEERSEEEASALAERNAHAPPAGAVWPPPEEIEAWAERARALRHFESDLQQATSELERAEAERAEAARALGTELPEVAGELPDVFFDRVEAWWREALDLEQTRRELETRRAAIQVEETVHDETRLAEAAGRLRDWLVPPDPPVPPRALWTTGWLLSAGLGAAALLAVAWRDAPRLAAALASLAGAGVLALGASAWLLARSAGGTREERARAAARFRATGLVEPQSWTRAGVLVCLGEIERAWARARRAAEAGEEAARLAARLERLSEPEAKLEQQRAQLAAQLGVDPGLSGLRLSDWSARVRSARDAQQRAARARASQRHVQRAHAEALAAISQFLTRHALPSPRDGAQAETGVRALGERRARWEAARERADRAGRELGRARERRRAVDQRRSRLFADVGVDGADPTLARRRLEALAARRPEYEALASKREAVAASVERGLAALRERRDLCELARDDLERLIAESEAASVRLDALAEEITEVETRVRVAAEAGQLEQAMAEEQCAAEALAARREEALDAAARTFLIGDLEAEHESRSRPAVLERAMECFSAFTHHRYELRVGEDEAGEANFRARETRSGRSHALDELSDGTRTQLWLAARLAFATGAEAGTPLPLFLDEALSASDPLRFHAVAESLLALAAQGRQILYLTCDPGDVGAWRTSARELGAPEPAVIDLAEVRRLAERASPAALRPPPPVLAAAPEQGETAEDYARRLGVPPPRVFEPAESLHLFHALPDDLSLLHRVLRRARIERLGEWRAWRRAGALGGVVDEREAARIDARVELLEAIVSAWHEGRGRRVERADLEASGAVTPIFLERVLAVLDDVGGDARALMEAFEHRDERLKGFLRDKQRALRDHLLSEGLLDERPALALPQLRARVHARMQEALREGRIDADTVGDRIDALWHALSG